MDGSSLTAWILLAAALLLILACGVFVAAEFAFVTVDRSRVEQAAAQGDGGAQGVLQALRSLSTQLSGAQVGITVTNLAIGFLAEPAIAELIDDPLAALGTPEGAVSPLAVGIGLTLGTFLTMIFGELVPKNLALAKPMEVARATQRVQRTFTAVMKLPIRLLNGSANAFVRRLGIEPQEELRSARSSTELASLIQRSASQRGCDPHVSRCATGSACGSGKRKLGRRCMFCRIPFTIPAAYGAPAMRTSSTDWLTAAYGGTLPISSSWYAPSRSTSSTSPRSRRCSTRRSPRSRRAMSRRASASRRGRSRSPATRPRSSAGSWRGWSP